MPTLLVVGGGLFGSQAAAYARHKGIETRVFDPGLTGAASPAAAGLFTEKWAGKKLGEHFHRALTLFEKLYDIRNNTLQHDDGRRESFLFIPPRDILEPEPAREMVTAVGNGWLETESRRHEGWVYVAAGIWCPRFLPELNVHAKSGTALLFESEHPGRIREFAHGRQSIAFVRDPGTTYFSDGTAERILTPDHEQATLARADELGLTHPIHRLTGHRPYTPRGPIFLKLGQRIWLATGGRKMGTILGASFARRLVEDELAGQR